MQIIVDIQQHDFNFQGFKMFLRRSPVCLLLSGAVLGMIIMLMIQNLLSPFQSSTAKLAVQGSIHQMAVQGGIRQVRVKSERQMDHLKVAKTRDENPSRQINPGKNPTNTKR